MKVTQQGVGRAAGEPRRDVHNSNVDEAAAKSGRCGTTNLATGRVCRLPALHSGGCDLVTRVDLVWPAGPR